jgi:hypothetical protein
MREGQRIDQAIRWHAGTQVLIHVCVIVGIFVETVGFIAVYPSRFEWSWLLLVGGGILSFGLTVLSRRRHRAWAWGLLGFLHAAGAAYVFWRLRPGCDRCKRVRGWGTEPCPACGEAASVEG